MPESETVDEASLKERGNQLYKQGHYGLAAAMYRNYVGNPHPDNKNAYYNMALCFFRTEKFEESVEACNEALKIDPDYVKVYFRLAVNFEKMGTRFLCKSLFNAEEFCRRYKQDRESVEWREMKELRERVTNKLNASVAIPIQERKRIFYPNFIIPGQIWGSQAFEKMYEKVSPHGAKTVPHLQFQGCTWRDVEDKVRQSNLKLALDMGNGIIRKSTSESKTHDKQNLEKLKSMIKGTLPRETVLMTLEETKPKIEKIKQAEKENTKSKEISEGEAGPEVHMERTVRAKKVEKSTCQNSKEEQLYEKHFLESLEKKMDVFEGFPSVVKSILKNEELSPEQRKMVLEMAGQRYEMLSVLQMSMSECEKEEIRKEIRKQGFLELQDLYCK